MLFFIVTGACKSRVANIESWSSLDVDEGRHDRSWAKSLIEIAWSLRICLVVEGRIGLGFDIVNIMAKWSENN